MEELNKNGQGLYVLMIGVHGLIRGHDVELGRDADTGGQTLYMLELVRALAAHPQVARVDLLTRQVIDPKVSPDYAQPLERLSDKAWIVRLPCGPRRYLRKEVLWPHLDSFADHALQHIRAVGRIPDIVHGHYADAGYVATRIAAPLGVPLAFTGHSLGRIKKERLEAHGVKPHSIEAQYNIDERIEAEELTLDMADLVITSTAQEIEEQYGRYDNSNPRRMRVIPPGVDLSRFRPPRRDDERPVIRDEIERFLRDPDKPIVLALSRPDPRKNIGTLVRAYAENAQLREMANLVVVAGQRDDLRDMEKGSRDVLSDLLLAVDRYDLYGHIAYPKHHRPDDVPELYRLAARTRGIFVNPALTEPFGLTLLEAAASGLPIIATDDGGPRDIIGYCRNGELIDSLDATRMGEVLLGAVANSRRRHRWAKNGLRRVHRRFTWQGHAERYLQAVIRVLARRDKQAAPLRKSRLPVIDRALVSDIDNTLIGDREALQELISRLERAGGGVGFGIATGRRLESAVRVLREWGVPMPDILITAVGAEIHYGPRLREDMGWQRYIDYRWDPDALRLALRRLPGLKLQPREEQRRHKISYYYDPAKAPPISEISCLLRKHDLHANPIYSHQAYLDLLPVRASKGQALRYLAFKWGLPLDRILVSGDSGNDRELLCGNTLGLVVGNYSEELEELRGRRCIHFAEAHYARGIIEGMEHYDFFGAIRIPEE